MAKIAASFRGTRGINNLATLIIVAGVSQVCDRMSPWHILAILRGGIRHSEERDVLLKDVVSDMSLYLAPKSNEIFHPARKSIISKMSIMRAYNKRCVS